MSAGRQAAVEVGHLVDERIKNVRAGHDDEHQAQDHAGQRRQVAAHAAALQGIVDGSGEQGDDDAPEDDIEEGAQHQRKASETPASSRRKARSSKRLLHSSMGTPCRVCARLRFGTLSDTAKRRGQIGSRSGCVPRRCRMRIRASVCDALTIRARRRGGDKGMPGDAEGTTRGVFPHVLPAGERAGTSRRGREGGGGRERMSPRPYGVPCPYGVPAPVVQAALQKGRPCRPAGAAW